MKFYKKIVLLIFIGSVFITCKKETITPSAIEGQPVFSFNGTIGITNFNLQAGVNNYYMYSSDTQSTAGVYSFIGTLKNTSNNLNSIQIIINDYRISASNSSISPGHVDSALSSSISYSYNKGVPIYDTTYSVKFTPKIYYGSPILYTYSFGDLTPNSITTTNAPIPHVYKNPGTYYTALTIKTTYTSVTMVDTINILKIQPQLWFDSISPAIMYTSGDTAEVAFSPAFSKYGIRPYAYSWNFGDGGLSIASSPDSTIAHSYDSGKVYSVYFKVSDNAGHSASHNYNVWTGSTTYGEGLLFDYNISPPTQITTPNTLALSDVTINYTDATGTVYTSKNVSQNGTFQITSVVPYKNNLNNNPTEMLTVKFSCMLYSPGAPSGIPASGTAVIAVAYH